VRKDNEVVRAGAIQFLVKRGFDGGIWNILRLDLHNIEQKIAMNATKQRLLHF
jgi:hypothetical protein